MYHKDYSALTVLIVIYTSEGKQLQFKFVSKMIDTSQLATSYSFLFLSELKWKTSVYFGSICSQTILRPILVHNRQNF